MFRRLIAYVGEYRRYAVLTPILVTLEVVAQLILPRLMAGIVDVGIAQGDMGYILRNGGLMLGLALISTGCGVTSARLAAKSGQGFGGNLRRAMFDKIQDFSFGDIDRFSSASLITRITNDVSLLQTLFTMGIRMLTRAPVVLLVALTVAFSMNAKLALVLLAVIPVVAIGMVVLMRATAGLFEEMQRRVDGLNDTVQENLTAIRVVKAFVREGYEKTKFIRTNDALTKAGLAAMLRIAYMQPLMMICFNAVTAGILWVGGRMVMGGTMLIGDLSSFLTYIFQILISIVVVAMSLLQLSRAQASGQRILEVLDSEPDIRDGARTDLPAPQGAVEFREVSFRYSTTGSGDDVLTNVTFSVAPGEFLAIVGGTGMGKSSLVNLIPRFYEVTAGAVLVDGVDVREYPLAELRSRIGMVLQQNLLFSGTIRENLLWGKEDATEEELVEAAKCAQAYEFIQSFPEGFDTHVEQGGVNLSGGQKQRLCIARAMLRKPAILILDDSTSAVDSATEAEIRTALRENLGGTTVMIIAQRISSVQYADRILVLDEGTVSDVGSHEELMAHNSIYQEIYASQQEGVAQA